MFSEVDTVLVQFRLPGTPDLPPVIRQDAPHTQADRVARDKQRTGEVLLERGGAVPRRMADVLAESGLLLLDARSQERVNGVGKVRTLVTFIFGKEPAIARQRALELEDAGVKALEDFLGKRWGEARVVRFSDKPTLRVALFGSEVEHPKDPREIADPEAEALGITITKSAKR